MLIKSLESNDKYDVFSANITLNKTELMALNNILYEVCDGKFSEQSEWKNDATALKLWRNFHFLFDIVKNGCVDEWTFDHAHDINEKIRQTERGQDKR